MWISGVDAARMEMRLEAAEKVCEAALDDGETHGSLQWFFDLAEALTDWRKLVDAPPRLAPVLWHSQVTCDAHAGPAHLMVESCTSAVVWPGNPSEPEYSLAKVVQDMVDDGFPQGSHRAQAWRDELVRRLAEET